MYLKEYFRKFKKSVIQHFYFLKKYNKCFVEFKIYKIKNILTSQEKIEKRKKNWIYFNMLKLKEKYHLSIKYRCSCL